jgi:hypothetical protein
MVNTLYISQILTIVATAKPLSPQLWRLWRLWRQSKCGWTPLPKSVKYNLNDPLRLSFQ